MLIAADSDSTSRPRHVSNLRLPWQLSSAKPRNGTGEISRLTNLAETLKASAAFDRQDVETRARIELARPLLVLADDLDQVIEVNGGVNPNAFAVFMLMIISYFI